MEVIDYTGKGPFKGIMKVKQRVSVGNFLQEICYNSKQENGFKCVL